MAGEFDGKVAIITGGATGIGRATATAFAKAGGKVVIAGRNAGRGEAAVQAITADGGAARYIQTDVSKEADVAALVKATVEAYGTVDYLFNNAGMDYAVPVTDYTEATVDELLGINIKGTLMGMKHVVPLMQEKGGGVIVNNGSFLGTRVPLPTTVLYGASKAAIVSLTKTAAAELGETGIKIYAVCPWVTDTPMMDRVSGGNAEVKMQIATTNPSGGISQPEDVAQVVLAMFAGTTSFDSGTSVLVDQGAATEAL